MNLYKFSIQNISLYLINKSFNSQINSKSVIIKDTTVGIYFNIIKNKFRDDFIIKFFNKYDFFNALSFEGKKKFINLNNIEQILSNFRIDFDLIVYICKNFEMSSKLIDLINYSCSLDYYSTDYLCRFYYNFISSKFINQSKHIFSDFYIEKFISDKKIIPNIFVKNHYISDKIFNKYNDIFNIYDVLINHIPKCDSYISKYIIKNKIHLNWNIICQFTLNNYIIFECFNNIIIDFDNAMQIIIKNKLSLLLRDMFYLHFSKKIKIYELFVKYQDLTINEINYICDITNTKKIFKYQVFDEKILDKFYDGNIIHLIIKNKKIDYKTLIKSLEYCYKINNIKLISEQLNGKNFDSSILINFYKNNLITFSTLIDVLDCNFDIQKNLKSDIEKNIDKITFCFNKFKLPFGFIKKHYKKLNKNEINFNNISNKVLTLFLKNNYFIPELTKSKRKIQIRFIEKYNYNFEIESINNLFSNNIYPNHLKILFFEIFSSFSKELLDIYYEIPEKILIKMIINNSVNINDLQLIKIIKTQKNITKNVINEISNILLKKNIYFK